MTNGNKDYEKRRQEDMDRISEAIAPIAQGFRAAYERHVGDQEKIYDDLYAQGLLPKRIIVSDGQDAQVWEATADGPKIVNRSNKPNLDQCPFALRPRSGDVKTPCAANRRWDLRVSLSETARMTGKRSGKVLICECPAQSIPIWK